MLYLIEVQEQNTVNRLVSLLPPDKKDIPAIAIVGRTKSDNNPIGPSDFIPNSTFLNFLHVCVERFGPFSEKLKKEANRQMNGIIYVIDGRNKDPLGAVPSEDIIGAFEVNGGHVHQETYRSNPNYLLLTSNGFFVLDRFIEEQLMRELNKTQD